ncbi:MAG TPA: hypothetical protein VFG25_07015 [Nitrosopumilaceae archaeon]|nr:hypothetical protein [Nitrosopumilaceae archaeon]
MNRPILVVTFAIILLVPTTAFGQVTERITILDNFGTFDKGENLFVFGSLANVSPDAFLIIQIINPEGDLCQIQQLVPLSNGMFITEPIPLQGKVCSITGEYEIRIFYGDYSSKSTFNVSNSFYSEPTGSEYFDLATQLVSDKINSIEEKTGENLDDFSSKLESISTSVSENTISELETLYVELWDSYFHENDIFDISPPFRVAITSALDSTSKLVEDGTISFDMAQTIDKEIFSSLFYYEIGNTNTAVNRLNDVFVSLTNVDPIKIKAHKALSFQELEETLLNLMTKNFSLMSRDVKEELAFIFARGTGPVYSAELNDLVEMLSQSRYLDVISRKNSPLFNLVQTEWESIKESIQNETSIEDLLEHKDKVAELYEAALLLRELEDVDRFITSNSEENSDLANLIKPSWDVLASNLELATSIDDILDSELEIKNMKRVIDASSRISKAVEISKSTNIDSKLVDGWESLLLQVESASSIEEILKIVSEFDASMNELREKRSPISVLKFEYETMKNKAEIQADHKNLYTINNALKILNTAEQMAAGNPTVSRIDRIEVLLAWASEIAPQIQDELNSYSEDAYKIRASEILQRAKSVENLIEVGLINNRFLPGYEEFTIDMRERINTARNLVVQNDLDAADNMVRDLFSEWRQVSDAYANDPLGSDVGYSADELKRIEYRKQLDYLTATVTNFYNVDFVPHSEEFLEMTNDASELIDLGNFIDAESKLREIRHYLDEHLPLTNDNIIYDISYDLENDIWILEGYVNKPDGLRKKDMRQDLYVTIYEATGKEHSSLEFTDTKHGRFFTQWHAPTEPGLYVVMLQYMDHKASQLINIEEKIPREYGEKELGRVELAREFDDLETFLEKFGGEKYQDDPRFGSVLTDIKNSLADGNTSKTNEKLDELQNLIERYLPTRSKSAVIKAEYSDNGIIISGQVIKSLSFSEDLYVDIFDHRGNHVEELYFEYGTGHFNEVLSKSLEPGFYVAQLEYHDLIVNDFFTVY